MIRRVRVEPRHPVDPRQSAPSLDPARGGSRHGDWRPLVNPFLTGHTANGTIDASGVGLRVETVMGDPRPEKRHQRTGSASRFCDKSTQPFSRPQSAYRAVRKASGEGPVDPVALFFGVGQPVQRHVGEPGEGVRSVRTKAPRDSPGGEAEPNSSLRS